MANNPRFEFDRYVNGTLMAEGVTIERENTFETAMKSAARLASKGPNGEAPVLVYRPAAPVEGLETVAWRFRHSEQEKWHYDAGPQNWWEKQELVTRSQAEVIIADWKRRAEYAERELANSILKSKSLEADNAALTARVKELSEALDKQRELDNESTLHHYKRAKALETQLAAARKALQPFATDADVYDGQNIDDENKSFNDNLTVGDLRRARAAWEANHEVGINV